MEVGINIPPTGPEAPPSAPTSDRPAWLPENFKSPEDLANSYKTLQSEYTKLKQGHTPPVQGENPQSGEPPKAPVSDLTIDQQAAQVAQNAGLDVEKLSAEFFAEGKLKDESYSALEKAGIPKAVVDDFIRLKQGEADGIRNEVLNVAGGEDTFKQMIQWAAVNYVDATAYNEAMNSGNQAQMRMAMTALKAAYVSANGQDPSLVMGGGGSVGGDAYANDLEMVADMQKPDYHTDPAFKRKVQEKVARSPNLFR
jgi:hypothetical protein